MTVIEDNAKMASDPDKAKLTNRVKMLLKQGLVLIEDDRELDVAVEGCIAALEEKDDGLNVADLITELERKYDEVAMFESAGVYKCVLDYDTRLNMLIELLAKMDSAEIIRGQPLYEPPSLLPNKLEQNKFILKPNRVPKYVYNAMDKTSARILKLSFTLTKFNYIEQFQKYLWIEEAYQDIEMQQYSMSNVFLNRYRGYFVLKVPGLEQDRPCLMPNDTLLLTEVHDQNSHSIFQGYIHQVRAKDVLLKFNKNLHIGPKSALDNQPFDVTFQASRTSFKWLHHGVCQYSNHRKNELFNVVFPEVCEKPALDYVATEVKDGDAVGQLEQVRKGLNRNQLRAVINVLNAKNRPAPYLIHGCPGGGKSRVVVELVHQIYKRKPSFNILVCGNSNACADLLAERLLEPENLVSTNHIVRIASLSRLEQPISAKLATIIKGYDELENDTVKNFRIIVTTCIKAGSLNNFPGLKFNYVIVDEAGHASEPETLIPIGLLKEDGCCVLVGDWLQLGPLCLSAIARHNILGKSLLERLAEMCMYQMQSDSKKYNSTYITKLTESYRSDPRVLSVNNDLFYESELDCKIRTPLTLLKHMSVSNPLVFYPIEGKEQKLKHSPSWYNPNEIFACIRIVQRLYKFKTKSGSFTAENIGIVTPYTLQIEQFNFWFDKFGISKCKIGTVEKFQGDERDVVLISTVRTTTKGATPNLSKLQFLFQPKRFNVATSRARFLTVVVGDPRTLNQDTNWAEYIKRAETTNFGRTMNRKKSKANNNNNSNKPNC